MSPMRPIRETIPLAEALGLLLTDVRPIDRSEHVHLDEALHRVVSTQIVATVDVPPFDRAAMDGYAVVAEDTFGATRSEPRVLERVDTVYTGDALHTNARARRVHGDRHGRPDAGRRRCGRDGRGNGEGRRTCTHPHARLSPPAHRKTCRGHRARPDRAQRRRRAEPEPARRTRGNRRGRRRRVRAPAGGRALDGERNRRPWAARSRPGRSSTSTASRCRR